MPRRARQSLRQVLFLMARRPGLLCGAILLGVLLTLAVKFTCSRAKNVVAPARPSVRFFSIDAPVVDLYLGQIDQVERLRSVAEVSLIFFYAPWCAHSMAARQEVQLVAKKLSKQVQFVAVNCWWNQGKCRKQNRLYQYPIIHLFYRRFGPIEYQGPFVAPYMESFILKVITPLTYLPSKAVLQEFLSYHEPRVVGFFEFNASPQPPGYLTYLSSALQALKRDFRGAVRFGVVTNRQVAETLSIKEGSIYLHRRFNSSLMFPQSERNFTAQAICTWVFQHYETILQWLQPPGTKSRLLERELSKGPALLIFLTHNPLGPQPSPLLQQVADIALRYHSCPGTRHSSLDRSPLCCHSLVAPQSNSDVCELCLILTNTHCSFPSLAQFSLTRCCPLPESSGGCISYLKDYSASSQYSACCRKVEPHLSEPLSQTKEVPPASRAEADGITGLRCQTNRTLRFYLLDVALNWPLAVRLGATHNTSAPHHETLGAHSEGTPEHSFATIVNLKDEVHYVLQHSPAATLTQALEMFIRNFSAPYNLLQRHLVGQEDVRPSSPRPLITELTTSSFISAVMDVQQDVLLIYYTQWCGFCSVLNHIIIQLARLLQGNSAITVVRVNVALNDLPWEFMVDRVPTILLFPRYRKHLSVKFPENLPISLPNLLRFVLQHSDSVRHSDRTSGGTEPDALLRAHALALQQEVEVLHKACERLSQQLAQLWRHNRRLTLGTHSLEAHNQELLRERQSLEEQHQEKSQQLGEAVRRLQELADTSESLLNENTLLRVLLRALKDRTEAKEQDHRDTEQKTPHMAS